MNWRDISYLKAGERRQKDVFNALKKCKVLKLLSAFDPIVAGTFPIGIYLPESDIDIICEYSSQEYFTSALNTAFSHYPEYILKRKSIRGRESIIARFNSSGFRFEIFGQAIAVEDQYAYRHMLVEHELLKSNGKEFRNEILALKEKGLSTEEAFASLLGIEGDPYEGLLSY